MMNEELTKLLKQYDDGDLDDAGRTRLRELLATPEGRKHALATGAPEAIFIAEDEYTEPEWEPYWDKFAERLETQNRWQPQRTFRWKKPLAMAAMLIVVVGTVLMFRDYYGGSETSPEQLTDETISYVLMHRQPAEILPDLHTVLGEEASFSIDNEDGTISITGTPAAVERGRRALAMLDREPLELPLRIALLEPTSPTAFQQVDALPTEELDLDAYQLLGTLEITPREGQHFRKVIDGRYETTCYVRVNAEGTEAHIVSLSVYDRETRTMLVRAADIKLAGGWTRTVEITRGESDAPAVAAISLLPNDILEEK